jgi:hypothetical protein
MAHKDFNKVPTPTQNELDEAVRIGHEIKAFSADNDERCLFIKFYCYNGDTAVVWFDAHVADSLLKHLEKVILGNEAKSGRSRVKLKNKLCEAYGCSSSIADENRRQGPFRRPAARPK